MTTLKSIINEALGETSALFMSQEVKGTEIIMPTEELERISSNITTQIIELLEGLRRKKKKITLTNEEYLDAILSNKRDLRKVKDIEYNQVVKEHNDKIDHLIK